MSFHCKIKTFSKYWPNFGGILADFQNSFVADSAVNIRTLWCSISKLDNYSCSCSRQLFRNKTKAL